MENKNTIAFIVEGEAREPLVIRNLAQIHFKHSNLKIITLPAGQNIYMLWQKLEEDDFDTDIIEILRESSTQLEQTLEDYTRDDFSEVYLFFDYDGHQDNLNTHQDVLMQMLSTFDNETDFGKLYISYPMVEALRDFYPEQCGSQTGCLCKLEDFGDYKNTSKEAGIYQDFRKYNFEVWKLLINSFVMKLSCLFERNECMDFSEYQQIVTPMSIYQKQQIYIENQAIFILSAFPEFLLDYFKPSFWNSVVQYRTLRPYGCEKNGEYMTDVNTKESDESIKKF